MLGMKGPAQLHLPGLQTAEQTLTGMSGCHRRHWSHKHKQSLRPTALHKTSGLTTDRQRNREAVWGPGLQHHYLSCFLGRVLLQNLGLAAGEERGLEIQAGRKQEKEH